MASKLKILVPVKRVIDYAVRLTRVEAEAHQCSARTDLTHTTGQAQSQQGPDSRRDQWRQAQHESL